MTILYCRQCYNVVKAAGVCSLPASHGSGPGLHTDFGSVEVEEDPTGEAESPDAYLARMASTHGHLFT